MNVSKINSSQSFKGVYLLKYPKAQPVQNAINMYAEIAKNTKNFDVVEIDKNQKYTDNILILSGQDKKDYTALRQLISESISYENYENGIKNLNNRFKDKATVIDYTLFH